MAPFLDNGSIRLYQTIELKLCGDIFCTEFWVDSESGLKIDLGGRISELRLNLSWGYSSQLNLGSKINPLVFKALNPRNCKIFLPLEIIHRQIKHYTNFRYLFRYWKIKLLLSLHRFFQYFSWKRSSRHLSRSVFTFYLSNSENLFPFLTQPILFTWRNGRTAFSRKNRNPFILSILSSKWKRNGNHCAWKFPWSQYKSHSG